MKRHTIIILLIAVAALTFSCKQGYEVKEYMNEETSRQMVLQLIPYFAKLPKGYDFSQRFDARLDSFYNAEAKKYKMELFYYSVKDSFNYFLVSRPAPSLYEKRIGIAGKFRFGPKGKDYYEEAFWTFKMKDEELQKKSRILFDAYVKGKDLTEYYPGHSKEEWIEFPDDKTHYSKAERRWVFTP